MNGFLNSSINELINVIFMILSKLLASLQFLKFKIRTPHQNTD